MSEYQHVQKLLSKVALQRFMQNFRRKLNELDVKDIEISKKSGRHQGAFNKTINEAEDLRLSSFLRYWDTALSIATEHEVAIDFHDLMNEEVRKILQMVKEFSPSDLGDSIPNIHSKDLIDLKVYVDLLVKQKAITQAEQTAYYQIIEELENQEEPSEN